jgi:phosphoglycolate phosphatase-like HAD superfamily hydrolase
MLRFATDVCEELGYPRTATQEDLEALERMEFTDFGRQLGLPEDQLHTFAIRNFELFSSQIDPLPIVPGMGEVVAELSKRFTIAIVTGNSKTTVQKFINHYRLSGVVELILSAEDPGDRVEKINQVKALLGDANSEIIMIGDAVSDIRAARLAGVMSLAVSWGHQSRRKLFKGKPDILIDSPEELLSVLV